MRTAEASSAIALPRMRRQASPISARSSVRIALAIDEMASQAAARAGVIASTHATPATAKVVDWLRKPEITTAAPIAATPEPARAMTRRGSLPNRPSTGATTAATAQTPRHAWRVCWLEATRIGITRYSSTIASTDQADCAIAEAAGGAVTVVCVIHAVNGHSASRPAIPSDSRTDPTTSDLTVQPGFVCRIGSSVLRFCVP